MNAGGAFPTQGTISSAPLSIAAIAAVCLATIIVGSLGLRLARATSDFYVAGRSVSPQRNASAISGEYLSAASFLGVVGLIYDRGVDMLWFPVGYTVGYVVLLVLVAAPLRRSRAYTLPDFAEARMDSRAVRRISTVLVVAIGWLYLVPQFQGASLTLSHLAGWPGWVGSALVAGIVLVNVAAGGMRSITIVQAMQYWIKLAAVAVPAFVLMTIWWRAGSPTSSVAPTQWLLPGDGFGDYGHPLYGTWSTLLALALGTMGLPHVVVRFYTSPDGRDARRTTVSVVTLLAAFYVFLPAFALLGRSYMAPGSVDRSDQLLLDLPHVVAPGLVGDVLAAMIAGGAFAAFLATASGLVLSLSTALDQDLVRPRLSRWTGSDVPVLTSFRIAAAIAVALPLATAELIRPVGLATTVGLAFAMAAATFAPLLVLGVWWRGLSTTGAAAGLITGGVLATAAVALTILGGPLTGWPGALLAQPAAWCTPIAAATMIIVSLATPRAVPASTGRTLVQLHTPEQVTTRRK